MKILVAAADYPNNSGGGALMFVHVRSKYYIQHGIDVTVLNFSASENYEKDGIPVITPAGYAACPSEYDVLVCHAANLRNHYRFIKKYGARFKRFIFVYHGHEIVKLNKVYPKPYDFCAQGKLKNTVQDMYDLFKLSVWRHFLPKAAKKSDFVFVSNSLYNDFSAFVKAKLPAEKVHIIHNSVGSIFEERSYSLSCEKKYDFITVRSNMDSSVYCMDLVCRYAVKNPERKFLVVGKGQWFEHNPIPENVTWINRFLSHDEMLALIDSAKCALMPTRRDSQGVMSCELAVYGIPLITSDIPVCREVFDGLDNVILCKNDPDFVDLDAVVSEVWAKAPFNKSCKFSYENTVKKEEELILRGRI